MDEIPSIDVKNLMANVSSEYDRGLATCRDYLMGIGGHESNQLRIFFREMIESDETPVSITGFFAMLGWLSAADSLRAMLQEKLDEMKP